MDNKKIGENIKFLRKVSGLTQSELAKCINVTTQAVSFYETFERKTSLDILVRIADFFSVSLDWIAGRDTSKDIDPSALYPANFEELKKLKKIEKLKRELEELQSQTGG